jgi:hypothetical protein
VNDDDDDGARVRQSLKMMTKDGVKAGEREVKL